MSEEKELFRIELRPTNLLWLNLTSFSGGFILDGFGSEIVITKEIVMRRRPFNLMRLHLFSGKITFIRFSFSSFFPWYLPWYLPFFLFLSLSLSSSFFLFTLLFPFLLFLSNTFLSFADCFCQFIFLFYSLSLFHLFLFSISFSFPSLSLFTYLPASLLSIQICITVIFR